MFPVDAAGAIVRKVVQEVTERVTNSTAQFKPTQATTDRPATVVTADQGGSTTTGPQTQPTYFLPQSFYSPVNLFVPIHRPDPGSQVPQQSPLKIDLTSKAAGQTTYEAKPGDTVESIAADHGLKPEDVLLTNPQYKSQPIKEGDKLLLLYDKANPEVAEQRRDIARKIQETKDPQELANLIQQDLELATGKAAIPGDQAKDLKAYLLGLKPGDTAYETIVNTQLDIAQTRWDAQGRTHEVWDPLIQAAEAGDWGKFEEILLLQFGTAAATNATTQAVEDHKKMLLTFGPKDPAFVNAVNGGANEFLVGRPDRAALEISQAYDTGGAEAAAKKLRELTDPSNTDPLTAALIFKKSQPTIDKIVGYLGEEAQNGRDNYSSELLVDGVLIFSDLSAAADGASRSPEGMPSVERLAGQLNVNGFGQMLANRPDLGSILQKRIGEGSGVTLLLEMAEQEKATGDTDTAGDLVKIVREGVEQLKDNVRKNVRSLGEVALPVYEPIMNWGGDEKQIKQWLDKHPDLLAKVDAELAKVDIAGYQLLRAISSIDEYAPQLTGIDGHGDLKNLGIMPTVESDPALAFALTAGPGAMFEAARQGNMDLMQTGNLTNAYLIMPDPSWPTRMARNHVQSYFATANKPASVGLSLFGTGTYVWGVGSHGTELFRKIRTEGVVPALFKEDGWRNLGFLGMYGAGIVIEGRQALALRQGQKVWGDAFRNHLKLFGWWNVIGTASYAMQGDVPRTIALGGAAGGTLLSSYFTKLKWARVGGTWATLVGSAAIFFIDAHEKSSYAAHTEPFNKDYLIMLGVRPEIANVLADNDSNGISPAGRLALLADYRGLTPEQMLNYLNGRTPQEVRMLIDMSRSVKGDDAGNYPITGDDKDHFTLMPNYVEGDPVAFKEPYRIAPGTIAGLNWWVNRFMPSMPEATPTSPPGSLSSNYYAYQIWADSPEGKAWQANQEMQRIADLWDLPTDPA